MTKPENTPQAAEANEHEADAARQVVDNTAFQEGNTATQAADAEGDAARQVVDNDAFQEANTVDTPEEVEDFEPVEQPVDHTETVNRLLTDDLRKRFDAVGIGGLEGAVAAALNAGRSEKQIAEELQSDIADIEKQHADRKAHAEQMEAEAKAEARRIERLTTASIILGHLIAAASSSADRKPIVKNAVSYADELIAQVDKA